MQTFTLTLGGWLRRLDRRNPLVRGNDRIEVVAALLVFIVVILAAPVSGSVGTVFYDNLKDRSAADRLTRHEVVATVADDSYVAPQPYEKPFLTPIQWELGATVHTDEVRTDRMKAGEQLNVWIDSEGKRTKNPLSDQDAATEAVVTAFGLWFATVGIAAAAWTMVRLRLNRRRYADWDRELDDLVDNGGRTNHNT